MMGDLEPGTARMTHPDPDVADTIAAASQVPHLEHAGWRFVEGDRDDWPADLERAGREHMVYIRHPETGGTAFVPELSAPLRERGWELAEEPEVTADAATLGDLKDEARKRGLKVSGTKEELAERIQSYDAQEQSEAGDEPATSTEEE